MSFLSADFISSLFIYLLLVYPILHSLSRNTHAEILDSYQLCTVFTVMKYVVNINCNANGNPFSSSM
mgnify:CR=1 FL=1